MKNPHAKYTYEYDFIREHDDCVEVLPKERATHIAIYRRPVKPNADGIRMSQRLLDIPMSEVQVQTAMQPPQNCAALCERLRQLSEEIHTLSEAMRQLAGNNKQLQDNGRQLWSFAAMPKIWAEKIEEGNAK